MWECVVTAGWEKSLEKQNKTNHPQPPQRKIQGNIFIEKVQVNDSRPTHKDPSEWVISTTKITIAIAHLNWEAGITVKLSGRLLAQHVWSPSPDTTNKQTKPWINSITKYSIVKLPWGILPTRFFWRKSLVNQSSLTSNSTPTPPLPPKY